MARSEIRLVRLRDRVDVVAEKLGIVLGANRLAHRASFYTPVALHGIPRHRERSRILDVHVHFQRLSAFDDAEAFDDMQLFGVWRPERVDEGSGVEPDRIDDERVAILVMADRFPE